MQYWVYAFKYYYGNVLTGKYENLEEARIGRDRLDRKEYEYADIVEMEWGKEPKIISSENFEYEKGKTIAKRLIK